MRVGDEDSAVGGRDEVNGQAVGFKVVGRDEVTVSVKEQHLQIDGETDK